MFLALALVLEFGCGYSLAGRGSFLPVSIKRIGIPLFLNQTQVFDVERVITEHVRSELIGRGKYTIVPDVTDVDAVLTGQINAITIAPATFNQQQQATSYVLTLVASIEFKDAKTNKIIWSNPSMAFREEYQVTTATSATDPTAFFGQDANALTRLATEFARSVVSAILEAF